MQKPIAVAVILTAVLGLWWWSISTPAAAPNPTLRGRAIAPPDPVEPPAPAPEPKPTTPIPVLTEEDLGPAAEPSDPAPEIAEIADLDADEEEAADPEPTPKPIGPPWMKPPWREHALRILAAASWEEFYELQNSAQTGLPMAYFHDLVLERVAKELELTPERRTALIDLFQDEQRRISQRIFDEYGSSDRLREVIRTAGIRSPDLWDHLLVLRAEVRQEYEESFGELFEAPELEMIRQHLRTDQIYYYRTFEGESFMGSVGQGARKK